MESLKIRCRRCLSRRSFLRLWAGAAVSFVLPGMDLRAAERRAGERPRSLLIVWLEGGASQLETWDPHPGALGSPSDFAIPTRIPGVSIARLYPQVASRLDALSVIRSLTSKEGDHERATYYLKTGFRPDPTLVHPSLGAIAAHELPAPGVTIPVHVSIGASQWPARGGYFGDGYDAYKILDPADSLRNITAAVDAGRQRERLADLDVVERAFALVRPGLTERTMHAQNTRRALALMTSRQIDALRLDREPAAARAAYGMTPFGQGCLLARRLIEAGVRAVEVTQSGFDSHRANLEAHTHNAKIVDPALATLLADLTARDLLQSTLVLCIGEFGRTPQINRAAGRDHWPRWFSCLVGGGGIRSGLVIGQTDPEARAEAPHDPIEIQDLYATILKALGIDFAQEILTPVGRPMALSKGTPIPRLLL